MTGSIPRLAATVVLLSEKASCGVAGGDKFSVLMMQRHVRARFMASMYAFPGGCVEPADFDAPSVSNTTDALRHAALRELMEETSCVLHGDGSVTSGRDSYDPSAASLLVPFARWVTPKEERYGYDTLFFAASIPPESPAVLQLRRQESEVRRLVWITPREALRQHEEPNEPFSLPPVTYLVLHTMANSGSAGALLEAWRSNQSDVVKVQSRVNYDDARRVCAIFLPERYVSAGGLKAGRYRYPNPSLKGEKLYTELTVGDSPHGEVGELCEGKLPFPKH